MVLARRELQFVALLESAAHLQRLVPGAVLVGGAAAILYADHRESSDHDHVVADLADRFEMVLEAVEEAQPVDRSVINQLSSYRRLRRRWSDWSAVTEVLGAVAARMVSQ